MGPGDIHGYIGGWRAQVIQQNLCLDIAATAKLNQTTLWTEQCTNLGDMFADDADLGTSKIIFIQAANLIEKSAAGLVVEEFRCDTFRALRETNQNLVGERIERRLHVVQCRKGFVGGFHSSMEMLSLASVRS